MGRQLSVPAKTHATNTAYDLFLTFIRNLSDMLDQMLSQFINIFVLLFTFCTSHKL